MIFIDSDHMDMFGAIKAKSPYPMGFDPEYDAALFLLSSPILASKGCSRYVDEHGIKFSALMEAAAPWSSGEKALIKLAAHLFNGSSWPVTLHDVFYHLDQANTQLALEAVGIRYGN